MAVTIGAICAGIKATLKEAEGVVTSASYDELTEGIPPLDCPRLHVYPSSWSCQPGGRTDRTAYGAGVQLMSVEVTVNLYARLRSQLDEDMEATIDLIDALIVVLQEQEKPPFFGVAGIQSFAWDGRRSTLPYADSFYMGARFRIYVRIF